MRLAYWIYEGTAHHGIGRIANSLRDVQAVFHAPLGDDYINVVHTMLERTPDFPRSTTSVLTGRDLAQGNNRLPETLRQVEARFKPELIVVSASCSTTLLQEDLQTVIGNTGLKTDTMLFEQNPFRVQENEAAENFFTHLVKRFARKQEKTPKPSINFIGPASLGFHVRSDVIAMRRMMAALGVEINVIAPYGASMGDLKRLPAAWLNVAPYRELGLETAAYLENDFGMPSLQSIPVGVQSTLSWLEQLIDMLNTEAEKLGSNEKVIMPELTEFSLDGQSAPSGVPWFTHSADMESFSMKKAFVFGDATRTVALVKFLHDELGMQISGAGTYLEKHADWVRSQLQGYLPDELIVTESFQKIAECIEDQMPDIVCGTQMERHSCRKLDVPCLVTSAPTHIENHLLGYYPLIGFDGADVIADRVYTTAKLGLEKHLIDFFGDAGLEYKEKQGEQANGTGSSAETHAKGNQENASSDESGGMVWTPDGEEMLKKVPFFVRNKVKRNTEKYALEKGYTEITAEVLRETKEALGA